MNERINKIEQQLAELLMQQGKQNEYIGILLKSIESSYNINRNKKQIAKEIYRLFLQLF